jgi:hypothetical protein
MNPWGRTKRPFNTNTLIINGDRINATVASITIKTMMIVNTLVQIGSLQLGLMASVGVIKSLWQPWDDSLNKHVT